MYKLFRVDCISYLQAENFHSKKGMLEQIHLRTVYTEKTQV